MYMKRSFRVTQVLRITGDITTESPLEAEAHAARVISEMERAIEHACRDDHDGGETFDVRIGEAVNAHGDDLYFPPGSISITGFQVDAEQTVTELLSEEETEREREVRLAEVREGVLARLSAVEREALGF